MLKVRESFFRTGSSTRFSRIRERYVKTDKLFILTVVLPTLLATLYFGLLASDVYVSESQFVVRSPEKPVTSGLGVLLKSTGFSNGGDDVYAAQNYLRSRDALHALNTKGAVLRAYSDPSVSIFNRFDPLGFSGSFEDLYRFYNDHVSINYDPSTSVARLTVKSFRPEDAYKFNLQLLGLAEGVVNRLNTRARNDLVEFAQREVRDAQREDRNAAVALASFRNSHGVVDPEDQAKTQLQMISKLQDELISARMQLLQLQKMAPENPQIPILKTRIAGLAHEVDLQTGRVAGDRRSLSATAVRFQQLQLEQQFTEKRLAAALTSLQDAETEARRKQAYIERIVDPSLPDKAEEPRRLRGIIATLILGFVAWGILRLLLAGLREHHA